jgi:hypothetical protein
MADIIGSQRADFVKITGEDEVYTADVIAEDGVNKLWVKATSAPQIIGNLYEEYVKNGASNSLNVNGTTPQTFIINALPGEDIIVTSMAFAGVDVGIKLTNFLGLNNALTNGLLIEVKSEDTVFQFQPIKTTYEFDIHFAVGAGGGFDIIGASSGDYMSAKFGPASPFIIKRQGTYASDDYIKVIVRDNISQVDLLKMIVFGQKDAS